MGRSGDNLQIRFESPAIEGEIDVDIVFVGGDQDIRRCLEPCLAQDLKLGGIPDYDMTGVLANVRILLHDRRRETAGIQNVGRCATYPTATQNQDRTVLRRTSSAKADVVGRQILVRPGEDQDRLPDR